MSNLYYKIKLAGTAVLSAIMLTLIASLWSPLLAENTCEITSDSWLPQYYYTDAGLVVSLPAAVQLASQPYANRPCRDKISIKGIERITMTSPLLIKASNLTIDGDVDGAGVGDKKLILEFNKTNDGDGRAGNCAIKILGSNVTLKNIELNLTGAEADRRGICIEGNGNHIGDVTEVNGKDVVEEVKIGQFTGVGVFIDGIQNILNGVQIVAGSGAPSAVEFSANSTLNRILPNSTFIGGRNVITEPAASTSGNGFIMTNGVPEMVDVDGNKVEKVDDNGFLKWKSGRVFSEEALKTSILNANDTALIETGPQTFLSLGGSSERIIESQINVVPVIHKIDKIGTTYKVTGEFLKFASPADIHPQDGTTYKPFQCRGVPTTTSVARLAVFAVNGVNVNFIGIVGVNIGVNGINSNNGKFSFAVDEGTNPNVGKIVLVPFDKAYALAGRASNYRQLGEDNTDDCADGNGGGGVTSSGQTGSLVEYWDEQHCLLANGFSGGNFNIDADSDGDGIPDGIEMSVVKNGVDTLGATKWAFNPVPSCDCDESRLSCWHRFDSDFDGISDGKDQYPAGLFDYIKINGVTEIDNLAEIDENNDGIIDTKIEIIDSDKDGKPNVNDPDSDNDGLRDGNEDRSPGYHSKATSYLYEVVYGDPRMYAGRVVCNLSDPEICAGYFNPSDIGVCYNRFIVNDGTPKAYNPTSHAEVVAKGKQPDVKVLACRSTLLGGNNNFNGVADVDDYGESDPKTPDTDGDCVCDGNGGDCQKVDSMTDKNLNVTCLSKHANNSVLQQSQYLNDGCPAKYYKDNSCSPKCPGANFVLEFVKYYDQSLVVANGSSIELAEDVDGRKTLFTKFKKQDENGIDRPDWERVAEICSDIDKDGIPDCVERPESGCPVPGDENVKFDPFSNDTDGDGFMDGMSENGKADVCPTARGSNHSFQNSSNARYENCNSKLVYNHAGVDPFVSCYLDRDSDGLRDCEEDKDMDGDVDKSKAKPEIWLTNKDEGLKEILKGVYYDESNPLNDDTDGDSLKDYAEVKGPGTVHTSPNRDDTDGDGLKDNLENRDNVAGFQVTLMGNAVGCSVSANRDTDPTLPDSDGDGLTDKIEVDGPYWDKDETVKLFQAKLKDPTTWTTGIPTGSNPLSVDSDGDGLKDGEEYQNGLIGIADSNPCILDSDGDGNSRGDFGEKHVCRLRADPICVGVDDVSTISTADSDGDGLSNISEAKLGTDSNNRDTDGDGLLDGQEDTDGDGIINFDKGDSNPKLADTDKDGLNDFIERKGHTRPDKPDTDGDCILDGIEDIDHDGEVDKDGSNFVETDPTKVDTDGDTLWDGRDALMRGEDLDCSGRVNIDAGGALTETDPRRADTDGDGADDRAEMFRDGNWSLSNLGDATSGRQGGCTMVAGGDVSYTQMIIVMLAALAMSLARAIVTKMRKSPAC